MADKKITHDEYLSIIIDKAVKAAKARAEYNKSIWGEQWSKNIDADILKYAEEYREALKKKKPFSEITEKQLSDISEFPDEAVMQWVDGNFKGPSPWDIQHSIEASKILPLLLGAAEDGKDWYSRSAIDLQGIGKKDFGYNTSTPEGFQDFLTLLGDYQQQYDRANLLKEAQDSTSAYGLKRLIAPTAWKEFENALASGGDYDKGDAVRSGAIDALANSVIIGGPTAVSRIPVLSKYAVNFASPVVQMLGEAGRQGAGSQLSKNGIEFEEAPIVTTGVAGATIPALVGSAQRLVSKLPGKKAQQFARGLAKANRAGDPAELEAEAIEDVVNTYNKGTTLKKAISDANKSAERWKQAVKDVEDIGETNGWVTTEGVRSTDIKPDVPISMELNEAIKLLNTNKVPEYAKALGVAPKNGQYSASEILKAYKKPIRANIGVNKDGKYVLVEDNPLFIANNPLLTAEEKIPGMSPKELSTFQRLFPARYADAAASSPSLRAGYTVGSKLGDYGGMLEATLKPVQVNDLFNLVVGDGIKKPTYQTTNVYKDNSKSAKKLDTDTKASESDRVKYMKAKVVKDLFDAVFKQKEEDE